MSILTEQVYSRLKQIPKGKITTYKEMGRACGTRAYRTIGQILAKNPNAPQVPCHRVVASDGTLGGYMGKNQGVALKTKTALLQKEGVKIKDNQILDFDNVFYHFK